MSRVLALIGNRPNLCAATFSKYAPLLSVERPNRSDDETSGKALASGVDPSSLGVGVSGPDDGSEPSPSDSLFGWGFGYYQAGEPLLRRRPIDDRPRVEISAFSDTSSGAYMAQVRTATCGPRRTENTPPFRFKRWLFAMRGSLPGYEARRAELVSALPAAVRANVSGQTDGEYAFHHFLASLDASGALARDNPLPGDIGAALVRTSAGLDEAFGSAEQAELKIDCIATNGEHLVALHRSGTMGYRWMQGDAELHRWLAPSLERSGGNLFRSAVVLTGTARLPEDFESVPANALLLCGRTEPPVLRRL